MNEAQTWIVINPLTSFTPLVSRFRATFSVPNQHFYRLLPPESPILAGGTSIQRILYALGHDGAVLAPVTRLNPAIMRQLGGIAHAERTKQSTLHLFGLLDNDSPYGSRWAVEEIVRALHPSGIKITLHLGMWHPTPKEYERGMKEIQTLGRKTVRLGSLYPIETVLQPHTAQTYIDGIMHPQPKREVAHAPFPLTQPYILLNETPHPDDQYLMANHSLHGLDTLAETLAETVNNIAVDSLHASHSANQSIQPDLQKMKHIMLLARRPSYAEAYCGEAIEHPYYEDMLHDSSYELLEMLLSPHFGYHEKPYRTVVLLDEERKSDFDWLLSSVLQHVGESPYVCLLLQPDSLYGSVVLTNHPLPENNATYRSLQQLSSLPHHHAASL